MVSFKSVMRHPPYVNSVVIFEHMILDFENIYCYMSVVMSVFVDVTYPVMCVCILIC